MTDVTNHQCCGNCKYHKAMRFCFAPLPFWAVGKVERDVLPNEGIACQVWVPADKPTKETDQ